MVCDLLVAADQMNATQKALTRRIGRQVICAGFICVNPRPSAVPFSNLSELCVSVVKFSYLLAQRDHRVDPDRAQRGH